MRLLSGALIIDIWHGKNADQGGNVHFNSRFACTNNLDMLKVKVKAPSPYISYR